jgi:hypothetical protein
MLSVGPYSKIAFLSTLNRGLRTFTLRSNRQREAESPVVAFQGSFAGGKDFAKVYVDTASLVEALG